jgi:hypothetical protein
MRRNVGYLECTGIICIGGWEQVSLRRDEQEISVAGATFPGVRALEATHSKSLNYKDRRIYGTRGFPGPPGELLVPLDEGGCCFTGKKFDSARPRHGCEHEAIKTAGSLNNPFGVPQEDRIAG